MNRHGLRHWRKQSRSDFILLPLQFGDTWHEMTVQQHSPKTYCFPASKWDYQLALFASWARDWPWHCRGLYHELHDTGEAWGDLEGHPKGCVHNPVVCCAGKMTTYSACDRPSKHGFRSALDRHEMDFSWLVHPWEILFLDVKSPWYIPWFLVFRRIVRYLHSCGVYRQISPVLLGSLHTTSLCQLNPNIVCLCQTLP